jgi:hypothetical protein
MPPLSGHRFRQGGTEQSEAGFDLYALSQAHFVFLGSLSRVAPRECLPTLSSLDKMKILSGDEGVFYFRQLAVSH